MKNIQASLIFLDISRAMITRCYLEITNICNLNCFFCPKTDRAKRRLTLDEFETLTNRLQGEIKFLYFHLMGEPLLHPLLPQFITIARAKGFIPVLTTNGTLLSQGYSVIDALPHKIQISLHSHEGNSREDACEYINEVMKFSLSRRLQEALLLYCVSGTRGVAKVTTTIL